MSRLDGAPSAAPVTAEQLAAPAEAVQTVQHAIPAEGLRDLPFRLPRPRDAPRHLRGWCTRRPPRADDPLVARHFGAVTDWVAGPYLEAVFADEPSPVFALIPLVRATRPGSAARRAGRLLALLDG
jgi:hypothetical protein